MNRLALTAAIALALTATPALGWDDKECADWLKTHPTPHPDCVQATPTPKPPTATPVAATPTTVPTQVPDATATPHPTATPETNLPATPVATPNRPQVQPPSIECIPCGEADAPTPVVAAPTATSAPIVAAAVVEIAPAEQPQAARPVQVLSAGPVLLPAAGTPLPYVASILLGLGLTIGGWLLRRGS